MIIKNFNELQVGDKLLKSTGEVGTVTKIMGSKDRVRGMVTLIMDDGRFGMVMSHNIKKVDFKVIND